MTTKGAVLSDRARLSLAKWLVVHGKLQRTQKRRIQEWIARKEGARK